MVSKKKTAKRAKGADSETAGGTMHVIVRGADGELAHEQRHDVDDVDAAIAHVKEIAPDEK